MDLKNMIWVGLGGMLGAVARYIFGLLIKSATFPYATGVVNIVGALIMGLIMGLTIKGQISPSLRLFLATGICGGFTTFSAFAWENLELLQQQRYGSFLVYTLGTLALGIAATAIGYLLAKWKPALIFAKIIYMEANKSTAKYWAICFFWLAVMITLLVVYREFFWLALPGTVTYFAKAMDLM